MRNETQLNLINTFEKTHTLPRTHIKCEQRVTRSNTLVDISQYNTTVAPPSRRFSGVHKARLTFAFFFFPLSCVAAAKGIESRRRAAQTSGPASMTADVIRPIDCLHAHNDRALLMVQYISGSTCVRSVRLDTRLFLFFFDFLPEGAHF